MHQVNPKRRRAAVLRVVAYAVVITLSTITTLILLYIALGYRFDSTNGRVTRSGLLIVGNKPQAANIYVDGRLTATATSRLELTTGSYNIALKRSGYRDWNKRITILPSTVEEVYYPLLIPTKLSPHSVLSLTSPVLVSQSSNNKFLLVQQKDEAQLELITLDPKTPKQTVLALPEQVVRENGSVGTFKVIEWALNNKQVLLEQTLPSGAQQLLSLDITKPQDIINISNLYSGQTLLQPHYAGGDTNHIYALSGSGILSKYSLEQAQSNDILDAVRNYEPYGNNMIEFARLGNDQKNIESGLWKSGKTIVVSTVPLHEGTDLLAFANYNGQDYFAIGQSTGENITVYSNPLENPILEKQLPFTTIAFHNPEKLAFNSSGMFLLAQNSTGATTYDFEHLKKYDTTFASPSAAGSQLHWLDDSHLIDTKSDNISYMMDYDFTNEQALLAHLPGMESMFSDNYQYLYTFSDNGGKTDMMVTSLVYKKE